MAVETVAGQRLVAFGVCLLSSFGLVGCSPSHIAPAGSRSVSSPVSTGGQSTSRHIIAAVGGVVRVGGASLMIPPGSLDRNTDIALAVGGQPPVGVPSLFQAAGPAVHGDLGGAHLTHGATLSLPLTAAVTSGVWERATWMSRLGPGCLARPRSIRGHVYSCCMCRI